MFARSVSSLSLSLSAFFSLTHTQCDSVIVSHWTLHWTSMTFVNSLENFLQKLLTFYPISLQTQLRLQLLPQHHLSPSSSIPIISFCFGSNFTRDARSNCLWLGREQREKKQEKKLKKGNKNKHEKCGKFTQMLAKLVEISLNFHF